MADINPAEVSAILKKQLEGHLNVSSMNDEGVFTFMKLKKYDEDIRLPGGISKTDYFLNPKQNKTIEHNY